MWSNAILTWIGTQSAVASHGKSSKACNGNTPLNCQTLPFSPLTSAYPNLSRCAAPSSSAIWLPTMDRLICWEEAGSARALVGRGSNKAPMTHASPIFMTWRGSSTFSSASRHHPSSTFWRILTLRRTALQQSGALGSWCSHFWERQSLLMEQIWEQQRIASGYFGLICCNRQNCSLFCQNLPSPVHPFNSF